MIFEIIFSSFTDERFLKKRKFSLYGFYRYVQKSPITTIQQAAKDLSSTIPTVTNAIKHLVNLDILLELSGSERNRIFAYQAYIDILSEGADPISSTG